MPFRGAAPLLREEEYDELTDVVHDGNLAVFDLSDPQQLATIKEIIDRAANGWYNIFRLTERFVDQPDGTTKVYVYCIWTAPYRELATNKSLAMPPADHPRL